ncbi:GldG family protein [Ectothiorhodospiraceae bacterium 2226]|nr:GldG family protein [Ectothiorhodospiraceae bacterium 2226]
MKLWSSLRRSRQWQARLHGGLFLVLFLAVIGLLAWLSVEYSVRADWTASGRHTLSEPTRAVLSRVDEPVELVAFVRAGEMRRPIEELVERYRRVQPLIALRFVDPTHAPDQVRALGVQVEGEIVAQYRGRRENVAQPSEASLTQAVLRLLRDTEPRVVFLEGHGERRAAGRANHDLSAWAEQLTERGFRVEAYSAAGNAAPPAPTDVLVLSNPQVALPEGIVALISRHLEAGGNLLWLQDPGPLQGLEPLAEELGLLFQPGVIVDPAAQMLGIGHPAIAVVASYGEHPATRNFELLTLFPQARGVLHLGHEEWQATTLARSTERAWGEMGPLEGELRFDPSSDVPGPLVIGLALARPLPEDADAALDAEAPEPRDEQRIAVLGDGDFASNAFLYNQGNLDLANNIMNWLAHADTFIDIPARSAPDTQITLGSTTWALLGLVFLLVMPLGLIGTGTWIWWRRRRR